MSWSRFLSRLKRFLGLPQTHNSARRDRRRRRSTLRVEGLEDRTVPAGVPTITGLADQTMLLGESVRYRFNFNNASATDTGYSPFIEVAVDTSGPDGATSLSTDGYGSPTVVVGGLQLIPVQTISLLTAGQAYSNSFTHTGRTAPAGFGSGDTIFVYQLPFGSFTPGQFTEVSISLPTSPSPTTTPSPRRGRPCRSPLRPASATTTRRRRSPRPTARLETPAPRRNCGGSPRPTSGRRARRRPVRITSAAIALTSISPPARR